MLWKKKDTAASVVEVALRNTGLTKDEFFHPTVAPYIDHLEDALCAIMDAVDRCKKITIVGDYDCDGVTASAILYRLLHDGFQYSKVSVRLPKRFSEGYGISPAIIDEIDTGMVITVDNGIAALPAIKAAREKGLDIVIIDHHLPSNDILSEIKKYADVIVDPHTEENSMFKNYCGAGLAYRLACLSGCFNAKQLNELSALAAIGTVADVMPLVGDNRNIVIQGLTAINDREVPAGLNALLDYLGLEVVEESDIGFKIGPIINACGRMEDAGSERPFKLLAYDDFSLTLPEILVEINEQRKDAVRYHMERIDLLIAENCLFGDNPMVIYPGDEQEPFPEGIVGILAGKVAEKFRVPAFVLTPSTDKDVLKGSGRTFGDVNLKGLLDKGADYIMKYGGHAGAAGLSVRKDSVEKLKEVMASVMSEFTQSEETENTYDLEVSAADIETVIKEVRQCAPYGEGNPRPIFKIKDYRLTPKAGRFYTTMGPKQQTVKLFGGNSSAIGFDMFQQYEDAGEPTVLDIFGYLSTNHFAGKSETQIEICDFEVAEKKPESTLAILLKSRMKTF